MIVVDTNLLSYLLLPTPHAAQAEAVLFDDPDWIAPALIHSEFRNVLLGAVRRQDVAESDVPGFLARADEVITVHDERLDGAAVLALALSSGCSAYDCEFVWLASHLRVPLVTADKRVSAAFPSVALPIEVFLSRVVPCAVDEFQANGADTCSARSQAGVPCFST